MYHPQLNIHPAIINHSSTPTTQSMPCVRLLLLLTLLLPTPQSAQVPAGILRTPRNATPHILHTTSNRAGTALHTIHSALSISTEWALALDGVAVLILAAALGAVDALLGERIADGLREAAFADLA